MLQEWIRQAGCGSQGQGPEQTSASSGWALFPWSRAGHSWEGDDPEAGKGAVDHSRPRLLAACILGAKNSEKITAGASKPIQG